MRRAVLLSLLPLCLTAADLAVDHITVAGVDLKQMQARLAAVGLPSVYGGPHSNRATEMALTSFPDGSYLELIAIQPAADRQELAAHYWSKQLQGNAGPAAWAVRGDRLPSESERLRAAGVVVGAAKRTGRVTPAGVLLDWETVTVGPEPNGTFFPFLIHDFTPRASRAFPGGGPVTKDFSGVRRVIIAVRDLADAKARYQKAYGLAAPEEREDKDLEARVAWFEGTPVALAAPRNPQSWLAARLAAFGEGPCAFVLGKANAGSAATAPSIPRIRWFDQQKLGWRLGVE
jgi:Glyoxalase-like domain